MKFIIPLLVLVLFLNCGNDESILESTTSFQQVDIKYLALGDSYTIGQSVCSSCSFPEQLRDSLNKTLEENTGVRTIAATGWTTSDLLQATNQNTIDTDYDLVTLLIGVNNQFQGIPFSVYENEFSQLLDKAIQFAGGDSTRVVVLSIPDYAFTPFGNTSSHPELISQEIDTYNSFAQGEAIAHGASFENITPITRLGLEDTSLISSDGLHPSAKAYGLFVDQIYNRARLIVIKD